ESLRFRAGTHGKPALEFPEEGAALHFNLSHSGDLAILAVAAAEIGVDVERIAPRPSLERLAERFFSKREVQAFGGVPAAFRSAAFYGAWVRKEAFLKATGLGLSGLRHFDVTIP